ncbi:MAG TPA: NADH-quinone oxidoreductase subunit A [Tepidisphaeraceae bacterium]|jgi:NADH-quinone oxidoreductase subunit A|nr:NADH-quinone oxidoreductase subunit A [Tepidisphaeraceae bacterium]
MELLLAMVMFVIVGGAMVWVPLTMGKLLRPRAPGEVKGSIYECGEPAVGGAWVQFDLRFYIVALVYLVFDVEVALFYPWAVVWGQGGGFEVRGGLFLDLLFFFGVILVGFAYLWRFGYLDWVRAIKSGRLKA